MIQLLAIFLALVNLLLPTYAWAVETGSSAGSYVGARSPAFRITGPISGGTPVNPNCSQGQTYVAALDGSATTQLKTAAVNAICGLVADGTFTLLDGLYLHTNTSAANARVNAINPGTFNLVEHGTVTFTALAGFTGDAATGYEDTTFVATTMCCHYGFTEATIGVCILNTRAASGTTLNFGAIATSPGYTFFTPYNTGNTLNGAINASGGEFGAASPGSAGAWFMGVHGANSTVYLNGSPFSVVSSSSTNAMPNVSLVELAANNNNAISAWSGDTHGYFFFGGGITNAQAASIYARLGAFEAAMGVTGGCSNQFSTAANYFNSSTGNDGNPCTLVSPCLTIGKANAGLYAGGASLNFNGSFTGCLAISGTNVHGTTSSNPITIQDYGSGGYTITSNCPGSNSGGNGPKSAAVTLDSTNVVWNNGSIRGSGFTTPTQYGMAIQNSSGVGVPKIVVNNVDCSGFGVVGSGDFGPCIFVSSFAEAAGFPNACGDINVSIINATLHGASPTAGDDAGVAGSDCMSTSLNTTISIQGSLIYNMGGHAGALNGVSGNGYVLEGGTTGGYTNFGKFNLVHDSGANVNTCGGSVGQWAYNTASVHIQFGEVYNQTQASGCDGGGYDCDAGTFGCLIEYVYSHNNYGPGFIMFEGSGDNTFRQSISENDNFSVTDGGGAFTSNPGTSWAGYNLTIYLTGNSSGSSSASCASFGYNAAYSGGLFANNLCFNTFTNQFGSSNNLNGDNGATGENNIIIVNNNYDNTGSGTLTHVIGWNGGGTYATIAAFNAATGQDANSTALATGFASPPSGTCTWTPSSASSWPPSGCPAAYSTIASGLQSAGANLPSVASAYFGGLYPPDMGSRDYYANAISPTGGPYNMGAYGVNGTPPSCSNSMDFTQACNSQYIAAFQ